MSRRPADKAALNHLTNDLKRQIGEMKSASYDDYISKLNPTDRKTDFIESNTMNFKSSYNLYKGQTENGQHPMMKK